MGSITRRFSLVLASVGLAFGVGLGGASAQSSPTQPMVVGATTPTDDGPRLLIRHLAGDSAATSPSPVDLTANDNSYALGSAVVGQPLPAIGEQSFVALIVDNAARVVTPGAVAGQPADPTVFRTALTEAVRSTFHPGEVFSMRLVQPGADGTTVALEASSNLDELVAFASTRVDGTATTSETLAVLDEVIRTVSANTQLPLHREVLVITDGVDQSGLSTEALTTLAREQRVSVSVALVGDPNSPAAREGANQFCVMARATGGVCVRQTPDPASLSATLLHAMEQSQSVFVTPATCVEAPAGGTLQVVARTPTFQSDPVSVEADRLRCESFRRFDPNYVPPAPSAEGSGAAPATEDEATDDEAEDLLAMLLAPPYLYAVAGGGALLLLLIVGLLLRKKPAPFEDEDDFAMPMQGGSSPLDGLPANQGAAALTAAGPVADQPEWLRSPTVSSQRQQLRNHLSTTPGMHVVFAYQGGVHEVPLSGPVAIGNHPSAQIAAPDAPQGQVVAQVYVNGADVLVAPQGALPVNVSGRRVTSPTTLAVGDEVLVGGLALLEVRYLSTDGSHAVFAPGSRKGERRLHTSDARAFEDLTVGPMTTLLGRDPLPYQGCRAVPSKLVIPQISNDHAELWTSGGVLYVRDLGSSNGVTVEGQRLAAFKVTPVGAGQRVGLAGIISFVAD